ncbi:MAG: hypothetical protein SF053_07510 [Bacteroidia bacterium]|nr:hypothetical protein [Bacteroidia bacterium]
MRIIDRFNHRFASRLLTPGIRFTALILALVNTPLAVFGIMSVMFGVPIPGLVLLIYYWGIATDRVSPANSLRVWYVTILYNLLLSGWFMSMFIEGKDWPPLVISLAQLGTVAIAACMIVITREKLAEAAPAEV